MNDFIAKLHYTFVEWLITFLAVDDNQFVTLREERPDEFVFSDNEQVEVFGIDNVVHIGKVGQVVVVVEEQEGVFFVAHHQEKVFVEVPGVEVGLREVGLDTKVPRLDVDLKSNWEKFVLGAIQILHITCKFLKHFGHVNIIFVKWPKCYVRLKYWK